MALPKRITIHEVGPREGIQIEKNPIPTSEKIRFIDMLSECHFHEIEAVSFVSPKWVPSMADAEQVVAGITRAPGTRYTSIYLNTQGMNRAVVTGSSTSRAASASPRARRSRRRTPIARSRRRSSRRRSGSTRSARRACPRREVSVMAAFGCNYEGDIAPAEGDRPRSIA